MQKPIPCLYYAQHVTELAILPSFKLNTSFNLEKEKRRREEKEGGKKCAYPRKVGGGKTQRKKEGGAHTASSSSPPLCKGSQEGALVFSFLLPPSPLARRQEGRLAGGYHSSSVSLLHSHWNNKGKGGRGAPSPPCTTQFSLFTRVPRGVPQMLAAASLLCVRCALFRPDDDGGGGGGSGGGWRSRGLGRPQ